LTDQPHSRGLPLSLPNDAVDIHAPFQPCAAECCTAEATAAAGQRDAGWLRAARWARGLAWVSLVWMCIEGGIGLWQGYASGSISLIGWALGSAVEGLASVIVVWRFTGARTLSETAERHAQRGVAVSFWLIAPYIGAQSAADLLTGHRAEGSLIGIVLTAVALLEMPLLGYTKHRLGTRLGSGATIGEGTQNYLCGAQATAVLLVLAITPFWPGGWWLDPIIGLGIAMVAVREGIQAWRGHDCGC
jgi:divalent metal cation (Fe/Co/Zn/Cd) transporter